MNKGRNFLCSCDKPTPFSEEPHAPPVPTLCAWSSTKKPFLSSIHQTSDNFVKKSLKHFQVVFPATGLWEWQALVFRSPIVKRCRGAIKGCLGWVRQLHTRLWSGTRFWNYLGKRVDGLTWFSFFFFSRKLDIVKFIYHNFEYKEAIKR